jgi:hypothetical protein
MKSPFRSLLLWETPISDGKTKNGFGYPSVYNMVSFSYTALTLLQSGDFNVNRFDERIFQDLVKISQKEIAGQAKKKYPIYRFYLVQSYV